MLMAEKYRKYFLEKSKKHIPPKDDLIIKFFLKFLTWILSFCSDLVDLELMRNQVLETAVLLPIIIRNNSKACTFCESEYEYVQHILLKFSSIW